MNFSFASGSLFIDSKLFKVEEATVICNLDVEADIAEISIKSQEIVVVKKPKKYSYKMYFEPSFIDGKGIYSSTLIDYEIARVTRNGEEELYQVSTSRNGKKYIEIYSRDGAELKEGEHIYVVWYKARNKIVPGVKIQSFDYDTYGVPINNIDLVVYLGPNLSFTNSRMKPPNDSFIVRGDDAHVRVYNYNETNPLSSTKFTINFKKKEKQEPQSLFTVINPKKVDKNDSTKSVIVLFGRSSKILDFILISLFAIIVIGSLFKCLRQATINK